MRFASVRRWMKPVMALLLAVCPVALTASAVMASSSVPFSKVWAWKSASLSRCIGFRESGTIDYTLTQLGHGIVEYSNIHVVSPNLVADVYTYGSGLCNNGVNNVNTTLDGAVLQENWAGYACSFNPSISVGAPWAIAISGWPTCGNRTLAEDDTDGLLSNTRAHEYTLDSSGSPPKFENENAGVMSPPPCYGVFVNAKGKVGSTVATFSSSAQKICL